MKKKRRKIFKIIIRIFIISIIIPSSYTIMLNSVLTPASFAFLPVPAPVWRSDTPPFRDTVAPLQTPKMDGLEERGGPHALRALGREAKAPHITRATIKTLLCQKAGRRKTIDEIVRKSRLILRCGKLQTHYASKQMNVGNTCLLYYHGAGCNRGHIILIKLLAEG